ncbi:transmembrane protein 26-like [Eleutherodactylus coqui]|uniref:transmembrane protein 26-like n=1 Tax=Eleutherodactylus coqui TaxID=57060 RepID=UPI0034619A3F
MELKVLFSAVLTRLLFMFHSVLGVWRVASLQKDNIYWLLAVCNILLCIEMVLTVKFKKGKGLKWVSPPIFFYLLSIVPSFWFLEMNSDLQECGNKTAIVLNFTHTDVIQMGIQLVQSLNEMCQTEWKLLLHQSFLMLLIVGKWLLPIGEGITRDQLSQLLIIFLGTAADILDFAGETLEHISIRNNNTFLSIILGVWTWSMLQFPIDLGVQNIRCSEESPSKRSFYVKLCEHSADLWYIAIGLLIQDGPFLTVRIVILAWFNITKQTVVFFAVKNSLMVLLHLYRLVIIMRSIYAESQEAKEKADCHAPDPEVTCVNPVSDAKGDQSLKVDL